VERFSSKSWQLKAVFFLKIALMKTVIQRQVEQYFTFHQIPNLQKKIQSSKIMQPLKEPFIALAVMLSSVVRLLIPTLLMMDQ
jgi:hypothetical protein